MTGPYRTFFSPFSLCHILMLMFMPLRLRIASHFCILAFSFDHCSLVSCILPLIVSKHLYAYPFGIAFYDDNTCEVQRTHPPSSVRNL